MVRSRPCRPAPRRAARPARRRPVVAPALALALALAGSVAALPLAAQPAGAGAAPADSFGHWMTEARARAAAAEWGAAAAAFERAAGARQSNAAALFGAATAHARLGHADRAFDWLGRAVEAGFAGYPTLDADSGFARLRADPRWAALAARVRRAFQPCVEAPESRRFDFWLGEWDVRTPQGQPAGRSSISRVAGDCALLERWAGGVNGSGGTGMSLNAYNTTLGEWQQFWIGQGGSVTEYRRSEWVDGALRFRADVRASDGRPALARMTFTPLAGGVVRQHGEQSLDGGTTWTTTFDLHYHPRPGGA